MILSHFSCAQYHQGRHSRIGDSAEDEPNTAPHREKDRAAIVLILGKLYGPKDYMYRREAEDQPAGPSMEDNELVPSELREEASRQEGEGRCLEGKEDDEGYERERHVAETSSACPKGFVDMTLGRIA